MCIAYIYTPEKISKSFFQLIHSLFFSLEHSSKKEKLVLNLSTNSLTAKTCAVLSKVIAADHVFIEYKFADCMLSEDGKLNSCFINSYKN